MAKLTHGPDPVVGQKNDIDLDVRQRARIDQIIRRTDERYGSAALDEPHLAGRAQALGLSWADLNGSNGEYKRELRDAIYKANGSPGRRPPAIPSNRDELIPALAPDVDDSSKARDIKEFGRSFLEYRDNKGELQTGGEAVGLAAAVQYLKQEIAKHGGAILVSGKRGNNTLDVVAVIGDRLVVVEAKAGTSPLTSAKVLDDNGVWYDAFQGTREYLEYKIAQDKMLLDRLKTYKGGKYKHIFDALKKGTAEVDYLMVHAPIETVGGQRVLGQPKVARFDIGTKPVGMVDIPVPLPKGPLRKDDPHNKRRYFAYGVATVGATAGLSTGLSAIAAPPAAAATIASMVEPATVSTSGPGASAFSSDPTVSPDGLLSSLKELAAEFGRMLSAFKDHVLNGLNSLATMVTDAASKMSGFVSDIVDSAGAQALIEEASKLWAEGQELINYAMLLSPVGTVTAAISAAITIIQQLVAHWDDFRAGFDWALKNVLTPVAEFFKTAFKVYITPYKVVFDLVMSGFNGMSGVVGGVVSTVGSVVSGIVRTIGEFLQKIDFSVAGKHFGLKSVGDLMVSWAAGRMADGGLVRAPATSGAMSTRRPSGIHVMAVIDQSVLRAAQAEERKIGFAYRPPLLHDGALARRDGGPGARTVDVRVPDVESAFAEIKALQARHDMRFETVGV